MMPVGPENWGADRGTTRTTGRIDAAEAWRRYDPRGLHAEKRAAFLSGFAEGANATPSCFVALVPFLEGTTRVDGDD